MEKIEYLCKSLADFLWGDWLLAALLGLGVLYTVITGGVQFRCVHLLRKGFFSLGKKQDQVRDEKKCSSYQALCAAVASCVGSGNIVGVSTAILSGGPGALFWMWAAAFLGMATKFGEIVMGVKYHGHDEKGNIAGGPMYYIEHGMHWKWAGVFVAVLLFIQNSGATLIQSNTISNVVNEAFRLPFLLTELLFAVVMSLVIRGGFKRLIHVAQNIVPVMAGIYVIGGLVVLLLHVGQIPAMLVSVVKEAFSLKAGTGALAGITIREAMRFGVARGLYSNEAGEGSVAVLHASAEVDHPVFPGMQYVIYISLILFASTSLMSQWYFGHVSLTYLKKPGLAAAYRYLFPVLIILGSLGSIDMVWYIQDCALGLLILPNIAALFGLAPQVRKFVKEFMDPKNGYLT